ncbi:MerR family transcriptional regulator [Megasphaera sp. DJF_B143]|uniref:MerR family transcriptional regulator n=1 Tax=Megasphaera sp. DJF_B143 TaxID=537288 RepID=UPI00073F6145|nr:MerR family transcriptional regulator [Megasphaera sp. DJF_B143]KUH57045.1 hypothetical protein AT798_09975 [Megasphaera sp. DJF_B143]MDY2903692.1 MerR family transcriptional regulator [Caecibacter massiliensis]
MKNNKLTIGQMAKMNHTTISTLRLYDKLGILKPIYVNPNSNYRYYDIRQCITFRAIQFHKNIGLSLKEVENISKTDTFSYVEELYYRRLDELSKQIEALNAQQRAIIQSLHAIRHIVDLPPVGTTSLTYFDTEYAYTKPAERDYLKEDSGSVELGISHLLEDMEKNNYSYEYAFFIGLTVRREDFLSNSARSDMLCLYVDRSYADKRHIQEQPQGLYACIYFDTFSRIGEYMDKLYQFCQEKNCTITGDVICRWMGTMNLQRFINHEEFLRLQVPVTLPEPPDINV